MTAFNPEEYVRERLVAGVSERDIRRELEESHSIPTAASQSLINSLKAHPEVMERRNQRIARTRQDEKKSSPITILSGVGLTLLGVVILALIWSQIGVGKPGFIPMMAGFFVLAGLATILKGCWRLIRPR